MVRAGVSGVSRKRSPEKHGQNTGRTDPLSLFPEKDLRLHPRQMRQVSNGALVFNTRGYYTKEAYDENPELPERMSYLYWSFDNGKTWKKSTLVKSGGSETGFLSLDEKHWLAYVRFNDQPNQFAHSFDGGKTWPHWETPHWDSRGFTRQHCGMPNGSAHYIRISQTQGASPGSIILITYGYTAYPFRAVVSHDGGNTFDINREYIISDTAYHSDCGYPSTVCFEDGTIVTTAYTLMDVAHKEWGTSCIAYRYSQSLFV